MNALPLSDRLRRLLVDHMEKENRHLWHIANQSGVSYNKLWRFHRLSKDLSIDDADALHIYLTGNPFTPSDNV